MPARILVVEDNPANLEVMSYLLKAFGYGVLTALDGESGVATAIEQRPDLILCDVQLPRLDGYGVVQRLKAHAELRHTPLIAVTAFAMVGDRERMLEAGFDGYLSKPIAPDYFAAQIRDFLQRSEQS